MLINVPDTLVSDALDGLACAHPELIRVRRNPDYVIRADAPLCDRIVVVSGGSGHEPMHIGYVVRGMLTAACPGAIFTSPTPDRTLVATREATGDAGILYVIRNYAGGRFKTAIEIINAEGILVATVIVANEIPGPAKELRRGTGATVIVEKIASTAAEIGASLEECAGLRTTQPARVAPSAMHSPPAPCHLSPVRPFVWTTTRSRLASASGEAGRQQSTPAPVSQIVDRLCADLSAPACRGSGAVLVG